MPSGKQRKLLFKLFVSGLMLLLVLYSVDFTRLSKVLKQIPPLLVLGISLAYMLSQVLTTVKWWLLARGAGIKAAFPRTLKASFIGMYANCFGLGTLGADIARAMLLSSEPSERGASFASVIADRFLGMGVLASIGVVSVFLFKVDVLSHLINISLDSIILLSLFVCKGCLCWFPVDHLLKTALGCS